MRSMVRYRPIWRQHLSPAPYTHLQNHRPKYTHHARSSSTSTSPQNHTLLYPDNAGSGSSHHDLASYAAYAARTGLDVTSKTYVGTRYEYTVAAALAPLGFDLRRVGGRDDCGIDLLGTWRLPINSSSVSTGASLHPAPLRVLIQCKATSAQSTRLGPHQIRELEGAFAGAPPAWRGSFMSSPYPTSTPGSPILGFLVAQKPATKGVRDALGRSRWPMGFVSCTADGRLEQMVWNGRAEEEGLEGLGVAVRFSEGEGKDGGSGQRLVLTWKGRPCDPV